MMENAASTSATDKTTTAASQNGHEDSNSTALTHQQSSLVDNDTASIERWVRRCAGCRKPHDSHGWGIPGPNCEGRDETIPPSSPLAVHRGHRLADLSDDANGESDQESDAVSDLSEPGFASGQQSLGFPSLAAEKQALEHQLKNLTIDERELESLAILRQKLAAKEATVMKLRQAATSSSFSFPQQQPQKQTTAAHLASNLPSSDGRAKDFNLKTLRQQQKAAAPPLQNLLSTSMPPAAVGAPLPGLSWQHELAAAQQNATDAVQSLHDQFMANEDHHANMFLAPASVPQGEKILRIIDFLNNIVPKESEQTLSNLGGSRLVISYGQQRPRLESVSLSQWVIAHTRIFHSLLFAGKLPTARDVRDYLAYTVKVMELAGKYEWVSV